MINKKREENEQRQAQDKADGIASHNRGRQRLLDERDELYKDVKLPDNLNGPQDHLDYIKAKLSKVSVSPGGKKDEKTGEVIPKKRCENCGSVNVVQQYDEDNSTAKSVIWTNEYVCRDCKTRMIL